MPTQADIDALVDSMARGELRVRSPDGAEVQYRSIDEMRQALSVLRTRVASVPMNRTTKLTYRRD